MSYVWINPVIASMYDAYVLDEFLHRYGHERIETTKDWGTVVKEKYWIEVCQGNTPVADMRCPKIRELLLDMDVAKDITMPEITPILIHCGREISETEDLKFAEKIITTPCQALADMGNSLGLVDTQFIPWNQFVELIGNGAKEFLKGNTSSANEMLEKSPIPPGFFKDFMLNTPSVTGEENIRTYFKEGVPQGVHLIELLYCENGCHNGDGVRLF